MTLVRRKLVVAHQWISWSEDDISYGDNPEADVTEHLNKWTDEDACEVFWELDAENATVMFDSGIVDEDGDEDPLVNYKEPKLVLFTQAELDCIANAIDMGLHDTLESVKGNPQHEEDAETVAGLIIRFQDILTKLEENGASW
jgi:hypothetical protein